MFKLVKNITKHTGQTILLFVLAMFGVSASLFIEGTFLIYGSFFLIFVLIAFVIWAFGVPSYEEFKNGVVKSIEGKYTPENWEEENSE